MSSSLVFGVGVNDGKYPSWVNGSHIKEYLTWRGLMARCYSPISQRKRPTYIGCTVSENFKSYSYFYNWCRNQIGFDQGGFQIDKDLLIRGNKLYSEATCLFLPLQLNSLLINSGAVRGNLPLGVSANRGKFLVRLSKEAKSNHIGRFDTPNEAFAAYKQAKEAHIKLQAEKWKAHIDPRAFAALMAYEVLATD